MSTADQPDVPEPPPEEWVECTECGGVGSFPEKPGEPGCEPCRGRGAIRATVGPGRRKVQYVTDEEGHTHVVEAEPPDVPDPTDEHSTPPVIEPVVSGPGDQCPVCLGRDRRCSICRGRGVLPGSTASTQREEVRAWIRLTADLATLRGELEETRRERDTLKDGFASERREAAAEREARKEAEAALAQSVRTNSKALARMAAAERQRDEARRAYEDLKHSAHVIRAHNRADRIAEADALRDEVVRLREALAPFIAEAVGEIHDKHHGYGYRCEVCRSVWRDEEGEEHKPDCIVGAAQRALAPQTTDPSETTETPT